MNVSILGAHIQLANSLFLSLFHLLAVSAESPNRKKEKKWEEMRKGTERLRIFETYLCKVLKNRRRAIN